jgi:2-oxoglutarate dehydrogenase E1 component
VLGFELGYSVQAPEVLVLWEAQYGDFINSAQVIVDQFVVSARSKWGQASGLVLLLPHAYEGQGPEHSSARLERFLQLAAEDNLRIGYPTTAAQYFHVLRRQARLLALEPRPLVLMTPKSLLRNPISASPLGDLAQGRFQPVLDDPRARRAADQVRRLILCSGKVYADLVATGMLAGAAARDDLAAARVEELYPFPAEEIGRVVASYHRLEEVVWLQEEPRNMGAWLFVAPRLRDLLGGRLPLRYVGRTRRASPAEGSHRWHQREQERLIAAALEQRRAAVPETGEVEAQHVD